MKGLFSTLLLGGGLTFSPIKPPVLQVQLIVLPPYSVTEGQLLAMDVNRRFYTGEAHGSGSYVFPVSPASTDLFFYPGIGQDTLYVGSSTIDSSTLIVRFPLRLHKNIFGYYICPKCHRADKTVTIVNSEAPPVRLIIAGGDTSYSSIIGRRLYEGCLNTGSKGYCQRDKIRF
ncbi:hypothetical protein H8B15_02955 [Hymenobacter sp. BT507]|uniref:Uncharacterized protein n=1 Tax=Hymenobacter citatus TaxID=2763506 RepID=A0ABR7MFK3_9BACT|nr:hypothetical protein [Hymenobacter citatus]MBC6609864.1 hypothetical protein [Hymenobacter citatus]